ncbi:MAG: GlxA family transcriptional regulator [Rhodospirillaceae bacterium]|nr:GlxA family transcriptional regulator [Rhodospirillaceae bacterium]
MTETTPQAFELLVIVTPNFNLAATVGFLDPFRAANYLDGSILFRWDIASVSGGEISASNGLSITTKALREVRGQRQDIVIVSSSWAPEAYNSAPMHEALQRWARAGVTMGALDTGAFILAEAGLLKGNRATTHYEHIDALKELYSDTDVSEDLFVFDGKRITCCGGNAATDCALHIIRSMQGDSLANAAARYLFQQSLRPLGTSQNPGTVEPLGSTAPAVLKRAIKLMEQNLEEALSIPQICKRLRLSQRQLDRLFSLYVRKSPILYYRDIRLDRARSLVTQTDMRLSEVAVASGFSSQSHFSRAYRERFGLSPRSDRIEGRVPFEFRAWPMFGKKRSIIR